MKRSLLVLILLFAVPVAAEQFLIPNAVESHKLFWSQIYPGNGWTLYCGEYFESHDKLAVESLYSMSWVAEALGCATVDACRTSNDRFNRIEADMHNLYPALANIVEAREDFHFGEIAAEYRDFFECDFEHDPNEKLAEPRLIARGNIARSLLYMYTEYALPLSTTELTMLQKWNRNDPPSKDEIRRNEIIEKLQGTRNSLIDNYLLADKITPQSTNKPRQKDVVILESL